MTYHTTLDDALVSWAAKSMTKVYPLGLVGERNYQDQIGGCWEGQPVFICHEADNPYDDLALKVETAGGACIGYIPKSSWLRDAIHEEGRGTAASIASIGNGGSGLYGVVIHVTLTDDDLRQRAYQEPKIAAPQEPRRSWIEKLLNR